MRNIGLRNIMLVVAAFLLSLQLMAQQRTIIGTVVDSRDNSAMVGVTVLEKGTTNGTVTDIDGKFSLKITTKNPVLVFSYVGYKTIEVNVGNQSVLNVVMQKMWLWRK